MILNIKKCLKSVINVEQKEQCIIILMLTHLITVKKHKKEEMVVVGKKCKCIDKPKTPNYGFEKDNKVCCNTCKKEGMINLSSKKCKCGSGMVPIYNYPNIKARKFCKLFL